MGMRDSLNIYSTHSVQLPSLLRLSWFWCFPASDLWSPPTNALLLPGCPDAALGFLQSQKCFTKALYPSAPFGRRGQVRLREVDLLAQAYRESESRTLLSHSPVLFLNQGFLSVLQPTAGKQKRDLSGF